jgi:predicted ribosome quality control (RQC) complex YloA/Tae2 family protein
MNAKEMNPLELRDFQERRSRREALEQELEQLFQRQSELSLRVKQEKINLDYERSDVEALEDGTFKSFFYSAIGKKEEKLMQEEDEVDEAERKYEATQKELQALGEEIRRVERAIKELDRADRDYQTLVEAIPARLDVVKPRFSERDALDAEVICKELEEQEARQALYGEIIEEGKKLEDDIRFVREALRDMIHEARHGTLVGEIEARKKAEKRKTLVEIQVKHLQACLAKGVRFSNSYTLDIQSVENTIRRAIMASNGQSRPNETIFLPDVPDMGLNVRGIINETEEKLERSRQHQADLWARLSELLKKYEA